MPRTPAVLSGGPRLSDLLSVGLIARLLPLAEVQRVLAETGRTSERQRDLPAHVVVYYVVAMAFYMHASTREVLRCLLEGVRWLGGPQVSLRVAGRSALSQARARLGWEPLERLFDQAAQPLAQPGSAESWYRRWRVVAIDGSSLDVADSQANRDAFGLTSGQKGDSAFPQCRWAALVECGTHAVFAAHLSHSRTPEATLARELLPRLRPGMLCLADRYYLGFALWQEARQTGADLLWRGKTHLRLSRDREDLADGSYLSRIYPSDAAYRKKTGGMVVRVIDYHLEGVVSDEPFFRLVTTILDPEQAPAEELAALYPERWEQETVLDEIKTHLRAPRLLLRSKTPDLVRQEFYGLLLAHHVARQIMYEAAQPEQLDPDRLSFVHTVQVIRRRMPQYAAFPP
jgi:hypothetical protein